jgi:hypothetical protein
VETEQRLSGAEIFLTEAMSLIFAASDDSRCSVTHVNQNKVFKEYMEAINYHELKHGRNYQQPTLDLLEVYAYQNSRMTNWVRSKGGKSMRFSLEDGDLSSEEGRRKLFGLLVKYNFRHVWLAPECQPWSPWSRFNMMRSLKLRSRVLAERARQKIHIQLCSVIYMHQLTVGDHFHCHMEQPNSSDLYRTPEAQDIMAYSLAAKFDMCPFNLRDPQTNEFYQKRTQVRTSSNTLKHILERNQCPRNHVHKQIAGTTKTEGLTIPTSKYCATYSHDFAKAIATFIMQDKPKSSKQPSQTKGPNEENWEIPTGLTAIIEEAYPTTTDDLTNLSKTNPIIQETLEQLVKRRRVHGKQPPGGGKRRGESPEEPDTKKAKGAPPTKGKEERKKKT